MLRKIFNRRDRVSREDLEQAAIHEAGHAVVNVLHRIKLWKVVIDGDGGGKCSIGRFWWGIIPTNKMRGYIRTCYAGYITESLFYPDTADRDTSQEDFENAEETFRTYFPGENIQDVYKEAEDIVNANIQTIRLVANELLIQRRISGDRVNQIVNSLMCSHIE